MPDLKGARIDYAKRQVMVGRLLCDTWLSAKEVLMKEKNYTLANLAEGHLEGKPKMAILEASDYPSHYVTSDKLLQLINHTTEFAYYTSLLMHKMQVLPLTKQLTCLAGNLWQKSLFSQRAERIEYLLLHEFHKLKYIMPDKATYNDKKKLEAAAITNNVVGGFDDDGDDVAAAQAQQGNWKKRKKAAYAGGLVLEPKRGFYDKCVLLLDFNSLYPSIIQEYNIDFTTVKYDKSKKFGMTAAEQEEDNANALIPEVPEAGLPQGVLPRLIKKLVEQRRLVKAEMKKCADKPAEYKQKDIRQMALKIMANSMYGCLGFTYSRFYAKPLAALVTLKGREILQATVDLANDTLGHEVIYGDTDSIMVYTGTADLDEVKKIGNTIKKEVNKRYNLLEIEIDGIMKSMLLLNKKKYASLMVEEKNGQVNLVREIKGLDLVRRDWCDLSHEIGKQVLDRILSPETDRETLVENIHEYLRTEAANIRANKCPLKLYIINKCLTKPAEAYPDKGGLPHVHVALDKKKRGENVPVGTHIQYVITKGDAGDNNAAKRAKDPEDIIRAEGLIQVDFEWYLTHQIHPPISRLLSPIEGTDSGRIAECLGLDASKFRQEIAKEEEEEAMPNVALEDAERFKDCAVFEVNCPNCLNLCKPGQQEWKDRMNCSACKSKIGVARMENALTMAVRASVSKFNDGWMTCEEPTCPQRTRQVAIQYSHTKGCSEAGRQCLRVDGSGKSFCRGKMHKEYSDKSLYTQLVYLQSIFDYQRLDRLTDRKLRSKGRDCSVERIEDKVILIQNDLRRLSNHLQGYLQQSSFNMINLSDLFANVFGRT